MKRNTILAALAVVILLVVGGVSYFLGDKHAVQSMSVRQVTADQVASAMQGDHFYADYRENTLLLKATVASTTVSGSNLIATFKTSSTFTARCEFSQPMPKLQAGETISILSEAGRAERQPSAVLLKDCLQL